MDISLTTSVLKEALAFYPKPEIFNTDQGSQYTAKAHIDILKKHDIKISMDGVGRATDNICIERFWRTIKWEEMYNDDFNSPEFEGIKSEAGLNRFSLSVKMWIQKTNAKGILAKAGRYGGTYAHKDIAFEFASWISPKFKLYLIKEFQRLIKKMSKSS